MNDEMALNDNQMKAIQYTLRGMSNAEIGELLGVDRSTVWRWSQTKEWMSTFNDMQQEIKTQGENKILNELDVYIEELKNMALTSESDKTKLDALTYLIDRVMGKATTKVQDISDDKDKDNKINTEQMNEEFKKFRLIDGKVKGK